MNISYTERCNRNAQTSYPIAPNASVRAMNGSSLPDNILLDTVITVNRSLYDSTIYVSSVYVSEALISVSLCSGLGPIGSCSIDRVSYTDYSAVPIELVPGFRQPGVSGWVVFGNYTPPAPETYQFEAGSAYLDLTATRVINRYNVTEFKKLGSDPSQSASGPVTLIGAGALSCRGVMKSATAGEIQIKLDKNFCSNFLGPNEQYPDADICPTPVVRSVNGVEPDSDGIITLRFE
jgi:hypothetical protein